MTQRACSGETQKSNPEKCREPHQFPAFVQRFYSAVSSPARSAQELTLCSRGLPSANQHTISGGQNNIIRSTDHAHGDNCGLAEAPKGTGYHASGVIGFAQRSHISAEYELPTLLLNENRVLPRAYIDNGKSLL